jgi:hypothetical protein
VKNIPTLEIVICSAICQGGLVHSLQGHERRIGKDASQQPHRARRTPDAERRYRGNWREDWDKRSNPEFA